MTWKKITGSLFASHMHDTLIASEIASIRSSNKNLIFKLEIFQVQGIRVAYFTLLCLIFLLYILV